MPDFRHRLNRAQQRVYDSSNRISSVSLVASQRLGRAVRLLPVALQTEFPTRAQKLAKVKKVAQAICDEICTALRVSKLTVLVKAVRPIRNQDEYHGLYVSQGRRQEITVWAYTAKRKQVVAPRTFLRTLVHEVVHHLDYTLLHLDDSFHTDGFFKRESSLVRQLEQAGRREQARREQAARDADPPRGALAVADRGGGRADQSGGIG